jgi:large subunit ribosomal protein L4
MAKVDILDWDKKKVGQVDLNPDVFEQPVKKAVLHAVTKWQLASRRRGTHMAKSKGMVSGGGKKPFKQKGTGSARQGSSRSPLMPGGGVVFGPKPRDYSYTLPKKMKHEGFKSALSHLLSTGRIIVLDSLTTTDGKTNALSKNLKKLGFEKAVLIDATENEKTARAARNLPKYRYYSVEGMNVYDLLKYNGVILAKESLEKIAARCGVEAK